LSDAFETIAHIRTDFPQKFGIPRQSGIVTGLPGIIVFEPQFRGGDAVKGIEGYDYLWLLWKFEGTRREHAQATVRPPRLGGNVPVGVFATRSPFRPNPVGLSSVHLDGVGHTPDGVVLYVSGVDMRDNTPVYDIKPYLPYTDSHPDARGGFAERVAGCGLEVDFPDGLLGLLPEEKRAAAVDILRQDPRPAYQDDPARCYGVLFAGFNIRFRVAGHTLRVFSVEEDKKKNMKVQDSHSRRA